MREAVIWAVLIVLGVPLWLCATAIVVLVLRNRSLRKRPGDVPVRVRLPQAKRWTRGHGFWVHDVFAFRGSPAAWKEHLMCVDSAVLVTPNEDERKKLRHLGADMVVVHFHQPEGSTADVAVAAEHRAALLGPFANGLQLPEPMSCSISATSSK